MIWRHTQHMVLVALKHFFDIDPATFSQLFIVSVVILGICKLLFSRLVDRFYDGIDTVKQDAIAIKSDLDTLLERWQHSDTYDMIHSRVRNIKNNFTDIYRPGNGAL